MCKAFDEAPPPLGQFLVLALFLNIEVIFSILEMALLYIYLYKPLHNIKM